MNDAALNVVAFDKGNEGEVELGTCTLLDHLR